MRYALTPIVFIVGSVMAVLLSWGLEYLENLSPKGFTPAKRTILGVLLMFIIFMLSMLGFGLSTSLEKKP